MNCTPLPGEHSGQNRTDSLGGASRGSKMKTELRRILSESARLDVPVDSLGDSDDLYAAGLSSLATVHVMLAIEDEFGIEIPDRMLTRRLFSSIDTLAASITELRRSQAAA
ncbi:acyl carrier protein [Caballeronia arationis]|jgi:acyl carrier protein|uniref:Acyl carrier protein n=2 Tax=Caballeronia arationis TaxID=1777142 RepID=A0A7Z7IF18_9BURK|nr:acyl carrier protein [Caballeronia arationis]SOE88717.1 Acyl carrier protein [Caballeronia arationis]